jgi:hypothetical protein
MSILGGHNSIICISTNNFSQSQLNLAVATADVEVTEILPRFTQEGDARLSSVLEQILYRLFYSLNSTLDQNHFFLFFCNRYLLSIWKVRLVVGSSALLLHQGTFYDNFRNYEGRFYFPCTDNVPINS